MVTTAILRGSLMESLCHLVPVIPLLYGATTSKMAFYTMVVGFHDSIYQRYIPLHCLLPCLIAVCLHAAGRIQRSDCSTVALICAVVFENAIIGKVDSFDETTIILSLALLFGAQYRFSSLPTSLHLHLAATAVIAVEIILLLPKNFHIWLSTSCILMAFLHMAQSYFKLQFTFLEYFLILIWTGKIVEAGVKFKPQLTSITSFQSGEVLMIVHCGITCVSMILCLIVLLLHHLIPIGAQTKFVQRSVILRAITFFICLILGIVTALLPSLKYFLSGRSPVSWILDFLLFNSSDRLYLCLLWCCLIILFVLSSKVIAVYSKLPKFCNRKLFHLLIIIIIAPGIFLERYSAFTNLSIGVAFCAFLVLEAFRIMILIPSGRDWITLYYTLFEDENRDCRFWISSNITLLFGCAIPIFLWAYWSDVPSCPSDIDYGEYSSRKTVNFCNYTPDTIKWENWNDHQKLLKSLEILLPHLGWITVGVGDSFAAIIGSQCGVHKWPGTNRTIEGTCAMFLSTLLTALLVMYVTIEEKNARFYDHVGQLLSPSTIIPVVVTLLLTSLTEAFTTENDNIVLPLFAVVVYVALVSLAI